MAGRVGGWKDEYEVSADSQTMTMHRIQKKGGLVGAKIDDQGLHRPQVVQVSEKAR